MKRRRPYLTFPSLRDLVDAELPLTEEQLLVIFREAQKQNPPNAQETVRTLGMFFVPAFVLLGLAVIVVPVLGHRQIVVSVVCVLILIWFCVSVGYIQKGPWHATAFRHELNRRGYKVCVSCGYWLRGLGPDAERCPECGKPVLRVGARGSSRDGPPPRVNA